MTSFSSHNTLAAKKEISIPSPKPLPSSIVVVGDLNGALDGLRALLRGTGLINSHDRWKGGASHLVQLGDVFNRGSGAREAFEMLIRLQEEARTVGGDVTILLGNHEVMTALGDESYCTAGEYLSFATARERAAWPERERRAFMHLRSQRQPGEPILPLEPRFRLWEMEHVPGKAALRGALGPRGRIGRVIRRLPVALSLGDTVFVHGGVSPHWARQGVEGLNRTAVKAWAELPTHLGAVPRSSILRHPDGPLWHRQLARGSGAETEAILKKVLAGLGGRRIVVGHSPVRIVPGGRKGYILTRFRHRLVCADVGIAEDKPQTWAALVIDGQGGHEWRVDGVRVLWQKR